MSVSLKKIELHKGDIPSNVSFKTSVAVDTETMGLNPFRDRLCVVQLSGGDGVCHVVQIGKSYDCPNLKALFSDEKILKIFQFARFDLGIILHALKIKTTPVYCTKIASKIARTSATSHGLRALCADLLGVSLDKEQQTSDWGSENLTKEQLSYAASDVLYLHALKEKLDALLARENRAAHAKGCFDFLPSLAALDIGGWSETVFAH